MTHDSSWSMVNHPMIHNQVEAFVFPRVSFSPFASKTKCSCIKCCNVNSDQSFADYFKHYRAFHGFVSPKLGGESKATITRHEEIRHDAKSKSKDKFVQYEESIVKVGPATLNFQRTLRVPDNAQNYLLPPVSLFIFPIVS